jgi:hypothetical protein
MIGDRARALILARYVRSDHDLTAVSQPDKRGSSSARHESESIEHPAETRFPAKALRHPRPTPYATRPPPSTATIHHAAGLHARTPIQRPAENQRRPQQRLPRAWDHASRHGHERTPCGGIGRFTGVGTFDSVTASIREAVTPLRTTSGKGSNERESGQRVNSITDSIWNVWGNISNKCASSMR